MNETKTVLNAKVEVTFLEFESGWGYLKFEISLLA